MHRWTQRSASRIIPAIILAVSAIIPFLPTTARAAQFGQAYLRLDRLAANTATGGTVCANATTTAVEGKVIVYFPSTYTLNVTLANWTVSTTNIPAGSTAWIGIAAATAVDNVAKTATFPSGDMVVGTLYCFSFSGVNTLTTAASAANNQQASIATQTAASAAIDSTNIALTNIANDQIVVTAVVPPTFIFTLSGNTDSFPGNLDPAAVSSTGGRTITVTTNAKGGWIAWAKDANQGLKSATANYTIASLVSATPTTLTAGTEAFQLDTKLTTDAAGGCTLAIDAAYNGVGTTQGGTLQSAFQRIASCSGAAPATANGDVITLIERAAIAGSTPAGSDYTDTITVVGAGSF